MYSPTGLVAAVGLFRLFHVLLTFTGFRARAKGYKLSAAIGLCLHDALTRCCARGAYWGLFPILPFLVRAAELTSGRNVVAENRSVTRRNMRGRKYPVSDSP